MLYANSASAEHYFPWGIFLGYQHYQVGCLVANAGKQAENPVAAFVKRQENPHGGKKGEVKAYPYALDIKPDHLNKRVRKM